MAAELADVEDSFHQGKECSGHAQMELSQIWVSSFPLRLNTSESVIFSSISTPKNQPNSALIINYLLRIKWQLDFDGWSSNTSKKTPFCNL